MLVRVNASINLDGPYLNNSLQKPRFDISNNNWRLRPTQADLPEQLRPFLVGRVEAERAPASGLWRSGAVVWNRGIAGGTGLAPQPPGWYCVEGGTPGRWANVSVGVPQP